MAITLINISGVSFRSVSKVFLAMKMTFNLNIRVPSHTTVLNWVKKQGIANFREKEYFDTQKWILIMDESIQFGNKKLLVVMAVPANNQPTDRALNYKDLVPLVIKVSQSWKADDIVSELQSKIDTDKILYVVSDNGCNLKSSYQKLGITHIEDVGHKFSWIIKEVYDKQTDFEEYTKQLAGLRGKLAMSKYCHIIPPNQRIISRFMNLTPLFKWGNRMIKLLEKEMVSQDVREKVKFVLEYKDLIQQTHALLQILNRIQQMLKNNGFSQKILKKCNQELTNLQGTRAKEVRKRVKQYFKETWKKKGEQATMLCSSDILESCFGKYKSIVKSNKTVGITDLCLCISTLVGSTDETTIKDSMSKVKISQMKEWKEKNIGQTLFETRNIFYKQVG